MFRCNTCCVVGEPGMTEKVDADSLFMEMICPSGTNPDDSPLYVLCCNDTCSFTWTGAEHINQVRDTHTPSGSLGRTMQHAQQMSQPFTLVCLFTDGNLCWPFTLSVPSRISLSAGPAACWSLSAAALSAPGCVTKDTTASMYFTRHPGVSGFYYLRPGFILL